MKRSEFPHIVSRFDVGIGDKWRYVLDEEVCTYFPKDEFGFADLADHTGEVWMLLRGQYVHILGDYSWDGCSMVPTPPFMLWPSLYHDAFGQFRQLPCLKARLSGRRWNSLFREMGQAAGGRFVPQLYWFGLTLFNPAYQFAGKLFKGEQPPGKCLPL